MEMRGPGPNRFCLLGGAQESPWDCLAVDCDLPDDDLPRLLSLTFLANRAIPNSFGSMCRNSRENESWQRGTCAKRMNARRNALLSAANSAMSTQVCLPRRLDSGGIVGISTKSNRIACPGFSTPLID